MSLDGRIQEIARHQDGVFTSAQAIAVGATHAHLARRCKQGLYQRMLRGAYRVGGVPATWRRKVRALCLVIDGAAAGRAAAALWALQSFKEGPIDLVVPRGRRTILVPARRTVLRPGDIREVDGIPVTSPELTLCDLAALVPRAKLEVAVDSALRLRLTTVQRLRREADTILRPGRKGAAVMRDVLDVLGHRPAGAPARDLCALLRAARLPLPQLEYPVRRPDGRMAYLDGAYPEEGLIIEIDDHTTHSGPRALDDDRERERDQRGPPRLALAPDHAPPDPAPGAVGREQGRERAGSRPGGPPFAVQPPSTPRAQRVEDG